ncbi:glycosyltransferase family 4 protein [Candidatus Microgenomates bacterium]|nr:glycosyltransferase family 4 protein [Candidatus Microgenomates bacterium]
MRIGIDARLYSQTGVGRYLRNLIPNLAKIDKKNEYLVYLTGKDFRSFKPPKGHWQKKLLDIPWHSLKEQLVMPFILSKDRLDLVHIPYFSIPVLYPGKFILTVHDLIVDHFDTGKASTKHPIFYKIKRLGYRIIMKIGIKRAAAIMAISQTTKDEIISHYRVVGSKITVSPDALDENFLKIANQQKRQNYYSFQYILYVGNAYPHKNLEKLIDAFSILVKTDDVRLVLAGDDHYFYPRLKKYVQKKQLTKKVVFYGHANDRELINLYSSARCLVFSSLMEGFGLPNLEALVCGCLPVVSDIPVFKEIWGNKLIYFNPEKAENIAVKILEVLDYPKDIYQKKVQEAERIVYNYQWSDTAWETLKTYENCLCVRSG